MPSSDEVKSVIKGVLARREAVFFSAAGINVTFETELKEVTGGQLKIKNAVNPQLIYQVMAAPAFTLQIQTLRLSVAQLGKDGKHMIFPLDAKWENIEGRREQRVTFTKKEQAFCEILNPYDQQTLLRKPVIEMSSSGLSLRNNFDSKLFAHGTELPEIKVTVRGEPYLTRKGTVVYSRQLMNMRGDTFFQTGVRFN